MGISLFSKGGSAQSDPLLTRLGLRRKDMSAQAYAALAALEAERLALQARLTDAEALADRDGLTGVLNRRGFMRALHRTASYVERYKSPAGVVYLDLDGFKAVNDDYGHSVGDKVLQHVARQLLLHVRESDSVGRLGGDEFGVILAKVSPQEASAKAAALGAVIAQTPFVYAGVSHHLAASVGLKVLEALEDPETALARADEAMYADKHARRLQRLHAQAAG